MCIQPIWKFLNNNLPLFMWTIVYGVDLDNLDENLKPINVSQATESKIHKTKIGFELEEDLELTDDIEGLACQLIELMITLMARPNLHAILKFGLYPLINVMSHYLLMSREQVHIIKKRH